ncbi:recombinase family protein [Rhizobium sp. 2MFCol3.1]|uniref:recombinase family protein n=1 Tax=Rhizobium sp. 2MFCol3.1 TaxID=1246459 RepID=UPI0003733D69|nr:recombinase family protein [Rhizobium sp. 2MFCol3.1]
MTKAYSYIRISSKKQEDGHGLARQVEATQAYAEQNGLTLDQELQDIGSGFKGDHVKAGHLGRFLDLVKQGQIPTGSTLIVESLDRLSRQEPLVAQRQLIDLLLAGMTIVTLMDRQVYHRDRDYTQLIVALSIMQRANDESQTKSERSKSNVQANRIQALQGHKRHVQTLVRWIDQRMVPGTKSKIAMATFEFSLNKHADTVREIFELRDIGMGARSIAKYLNDRNVPVLKPGMSKTQKWKDPIIRLILQNEAAIGTYHVFETVDGKRVQMGEPIRNYFPAAVDEDLFWRVQGKNKQLTTRGAKGRVHTNLFTALSCCATCGNRLRIKHSGGIKKEGDDPRYRLYQCMGYETMGKTVCNTKRKSVPYEPLEKAILDHATEFYLASDLAGNRAYRESDLKRMISDLSANIAKNEKQRANFIAAVGSAEDAEDRLAYQTQASAARQQIEADKSQLAEYEIALRELNEQEVERSNVAEMIAMERLRWTTASDDEVMQSRSRVSLALRKFISRVEVNLDQQETIVFVAGGLKGYRFDTAGNLTGKYDLTPSFQTINGETPYTMEHLTNHMNALGFKDAEKATANEAAAQILSLAGISPEAKPKALHSK